MPELDITAPNGATDIDENFTRKDIFIANIAGSSLKRLPNTFGRMSNMIRLRIHNCPALTALPASIGDLASLETLVLQKCGLTQIPETLGRLKSLTLLHIQDCPALEALPATLGQLERLCSLQLFKCGKLQTLPDSVSRLSSLQSVNIFGLGNPTRIPLLHQNVLLHLTISVGMCTSVELSLMNIFNVMERDWASFCRRNKWAKRHIIVRTLRALLLCNQRQRFCLPPEVWAKHVFESV